MRRSTIFSIGLLISFFLPWIDLTFYTLSGYNIPTSLDKLVNVGNAFSGIIRNEDITYKLSYLLYLIPVVSMFNIITNITRKEEKISGMIEFSLGILFTSIIFISTYFLYIEALYKFSFGFYLTAIFSIIGMVSVFLEILSANRKINIKSSKSLIQTEEASFLDKTTLLNQLEQLKTLRENNILTDDIFEQQKEDILVNTRDSAYC